ncbi:MAG: universal stress protein [Nitrospiraceae bacterium]|nr:universal stress protein [Nitrospiraceae bacterium]
MYKTIVVGYDESESSKAALKEASLRVKRNQGKLYLVHAVYFDQEEFAILPAQMEQRFSVGEKICKTVKTDLQKDYGLNGSVESLVCEGEPPAVISDIARGKQADLIAVGTYGRKGIKRLIMGSVTSQLINEAPCDVLVVKRPCSACTGSYVSVLVPYDGSDSSKKALRRAGMMAKEEGSRITVLYVVPRYEEMIEFFRTDSIRKSMMAEAEKVIAGALKIADEDGFAIGTIIREGHAADEVLATAAKQENDLIAMGSHGWTGMNKAIMGSTTTRVISSAVCPILVVK